MKEVDRGKSVREPIEIFCSKKTCSLRPTALAARPMTQVYCSSILPLASAPEENEATTAGGDVASGSSLGSYQVWSELSQ